MSDVILGAQGFNTTILSAFTSALDLIDTNEK